MASERGRVSPSSAWLCRIVLIVILAGSIGPTTPLKIYQSLIHCYRGNSTRHWSANSLQNLLELVRKVEEAYPTSIDMRMMAVSILHELRIDGIQRAPGAPETEYTIPYGIKGIMAPRFQLLLKVVSDTSSPINFTQVLTPMELCAFHFLVSSTVEPLVRGDESKTCSPNVNGATNELRVQCTNKVTTFPNGKVLVIPGDISSCPEEMGVVRTFNYGSFSPGTVIGAIAAGLQPQAVNVRDLLRKDADSSTDANRIESIADRVGDFSNNYIAGIAGDLAEVCVYQSPYYGDNVSVGLPAYWDDHNFPTARYLVNDHSNLWQTTDSEILAGIDSYHLSMFIKSWVDRVQTLRLSQVLEMFYSPRGVPTSAIENINRPRKIPGQFDNLEEAETARIARMNRQNSGSPYLDNYYEAHNIEDSLDSACERKRILERISNRVLKEETFKVAQVLQFSVPSLGVNDDLLYQACNNAVDRFYAYARTILNRLPECKNIPTNYRRANIDLTMIVDGSRDKYQTHKLIGTVAEMIDVSQFGSYLTVVHGGSNDLLVSRTNSILQAFEELQYFDEKYPTAFSLSTSLSKVVQMFSAYDQNANFTISQKARVVLIVSQSQKITDDDFKNADWLFSGSLQQFRNVYYIFVTNDRKAFEDLSNNVSKTAYVLPNQYTIIDSSDPEPKTFLPDLEKILRQIPKQLTVPRCDSVSSGYEEGGGPSRNQFEDYVSPNQANMYLINPTDLHNLAELRVRFEGVGYGGFTVCMVRGARQCQSTTLTDAIQFNVSRPCQSEDLKACSGITFTVELDSSNMRCVESDCRYPDQVRYLISLDPADCRAGGGVASHLSNCAVVILLALFMLLLNIF